MFSITMAGRHRYNDDNAGDDDDDKHDGHNKNDDDAHCEWDKGQGSQLSSELKLRNDDDGNVET